MQKTKNIFTLLLVLPTILWMMVNPVSLPKHSVEKIVKSHSKKDAKIPQKLVISEQSAFHSSPTPSFEFPSEFIFKTHFTFDFPVVKEGVLNLFTFARSKIFTILFTQYISTLAP